MPDQHIGEPAGPTEARPDLRRIAGDAVIGAAASLGVTTILSPWVRLFESVPLLLQFVVFGAICAGVAFLVRWRRLRSAPARDQSPLLVKVLAWGRWTLVKLLWALAGLGAVGLVWGFFQIPRLFSDPPCPPPTEIRLVTAAENLPALSARAAEFADANVLDGCPSLRLTVAPAPALGNLIDGLNNRWERRDNRPDTEPYLRLYGLQPDAWIATSSAEAELVRAGITDKNLMTVGASVGQDQLVLAMLRSDADRLLDRLTDPEGQPFGRIWEKVSDDLGMRLARPFSETSAAALIGADDIFAALDAESAQTLEKSIVTGPLSADTVTALLCAFHDPAKQPAKQPKTALLVPGHSVRDYNNARLIDDQDAARAKGCPTTEQYGAAVLAAYRPARFSKLDYPFVQLSWEDQQSKERRELVARFGQWLSANPLFGEASGQNPRTPTVAGLRRTRAMLEDEIRPVLDVRLLLDSSGSAIDALRAPVAEAVRGLTVLLGPRDGVGVSGLAAAVEGGAAQAVEIAGPVGRDELGALAERIRTAQSGGWDAPLSQGLREVDDSAGPDAQAVVVLTDGRLFNDEGRDPATAIGEALEESPSITGLHVLVLGGRGCAVDRLRATAKPYTCVAVRGSLEDALANAIIASRGQG